MNISVLGLGYVGAVSLACLARDGHTVFGADTDQTKLDLIMDGKSPIVDEGMDRLMADAAASGRVQVTRDSTEAVLETEVSFVCVGTPSAANSNQDLSAIKRVTEQIGTALKRKDDYHVIIIRSTVSPGTTEELIRLIIEETSGKKMGQDFGLGFQPEFLREGSSIKDYDNPPYTVIGGEGKTVEKVEEIYRHISGDFITTSIRSAEMLKFCCNVFHALKVTFANEVGRVCQSMQVDSHQVMDLLCRDRHLNISSVYMRPGFAFGGSCLPKDLRAFTKMAKDHDLDIPMLSHVIPSNRAHIEHALQTVYNSGKKRIGIMGLSFKSGTDDLRESPMVLLAEQFIGKGLQLKIFDPKVNVARLIGSNRHYIEENIPHIASLMLSSCDQLIQESDLIVVGITDPEIMEALYANIQPHHTILDLVGMPNRHGLKNRYIGICW